MTKAAQIESSIALASGKHSFGRTAKSVSVPAGGTRARDLADHYRTTEASSVAGTCLRLEVRAEEGDDAPASVFG